MFFNYLAYDKKYKNPVGAAVKNCPLSFYIESDTEFAALLLTKEGESEVCYPMLKTGGGFKISISVTTRGLYFYRFLAECGGQKQYFYRGEDLSAAKSGEYWQLTVCDGQPKRAFNGGVVYQIFPDRFFIGEKRFAAKGINRSDWGGVPKYIADEDGTVRRNDFFGGNLYGIIQKLGFLKSLGVTAIYLNPIFEASSNHKYDTGDYFKVDGCFGGDEALYNLIKKAKSKNISVILDGVFSHTGADSVYFNKYGNYDSVGAAQSKDSVYRSWYKFGDYKGGVKTWWGVKDLPETDKENPYYKEFICGVDGVVRRYIRLGIGGWRLDVADELSDGFLDSLCAAARRENPASVIIGEVWENASDKISYGVRRRYFQGGQLSGVTNYPLKDAVLRFCLDKNAENLKRTVLNQVEKYPYNALLNCFNMLSSHDTPRAVTVLSGESMPKDTASSASAPKPNVTAIDRLKLAAALMYTLPGTPVIFYGDETALSGWGDPFNRGCYPWEKQDSAITDYFKKLGRLRKLKSLTEGDIKILKAENGLFIFSRGNYTVIINNGEGVFCLGKTYLEKINGQKISSVPQLSAAVISGVYLI